MTLADRLARDVPAGVTSRAETGQDLAFIERLYASTRADELARVPWPQAAVAEFLRLQCALQRAHYQQHYADALFLVIERDRVPIGRIYLHESASEIRLMEIALLPESRGQGLGTALLRSVLAAARTRGVRVTLHVEPDNPAQRLYTRLGFRLVERRGVYDFLEWVPTRPLEELRAADFEEALRQAFTLRQESGETLALVLDAVTRRPLATPGGRESFSLVFESESGVALPQRIYRLEQATLGVLDVFLVPLGPGTAGMRYEAVFG